MCTIFYPVVNIWPDQYIYIFEPIYHTSYIYNTLIGDRNPVLRISHHDPIEIKRDPACVLVLGGEW